MKFMELDTKLFLLVTVYSSWLQNFYLFMGISIVC